MTLTGKMLPPAKSLAEWRLNRGLLKRLGQKWRLNRSNLENLGKWLSYLTS